jgi:hypothetical protein
MPLRAIDGDHWNWRMPGIRRAFQLTPGSVAAVEGGQALSRIYHNLAENGAKEAGEG